MYKYLKNWKCYKKYSSSLWRWFSVLQQSDRTTACWIFTGVFKNTKQDAKALKRSFFRTHAAALLRENGRLCVYSVCPAEHEQHTSPLPGKNLSKLTQTHAHTDTYDPHDNRQRCATIRPSLPEWRRSSGEAGGGTWGEANGAGEAWMHENRSEVTGPTHGHLVSAQVVDQRLHVGEDAFGVWFVTHDHHVFHFQQRHAVGVGPEEQAYRAACMRKQDRQERSWEGEHSDSENHHGWFWLFIFKPSIVCFSQDYWLYSPPPCFL